MDDCIHRAKEEPHVMVVHGEHYDLDMIGDQAFEFPLRVGHTFMEEEKHTMI